jgi:hypothetical protein
MAAIKIPYDRACRLPMVVGMVLWAASLGSAVEPDAGARREISGLYSVLSDAVRASNDVYLAERVAAFPATEFYRRIDAWWVSYAANVETQSTWSRLATQFGSTGEPLPGLIDRSSFFRTAQRLRTEIQRQSEGGAAVADRVRMEKFAATVVRDFVRRGVVRSYQLRSSMWYEPVWVLTQQNGYCVDYADWYYWLARIAGVQADVVLASTSDAVDFPDHVLNLVTYSNGGIEVIEPQLASGCGPLAWLLVLSESGEQWRLERVTPAELSSRNAADMRGLGAYVIESLRYQERADQTLACINRCTFDPTFRTDRDKYAAAIKKATSAWAQFSEYADVSAAGRVNYEVPVLQRLAELYGVTGQPQLAEKVAGNVRASIESYAAPSQPVPLRIDSLFLLSEIQEGSAFRLMENDPARALHELDAAEESLRLADQLGAACRQKYLEHNFDLRMARICSLRARIYRGHALTLRVVAKGTPADEQALAYAEKAVVAHRLLREQLDEELNVASNLRGFGLIQKRTFRQSTDRFLRESYLALGDAHQDRGLTMLASAGGPVSAGASAADPALLLEAQQHLRQALRCFEARTQINDKTGEPDWRRIYDVRIQLARVAVALGQRESAAEEDAAAEEAGRKIRGGMHDPIRLEAWQHQDASLRNTTP